MTKEGKILLVSIIGTTILISGLAVWMTRTTGQTEGASSLLPNTQTQNIAVNPSSAMQLGDVDYNGGIVTRSFDVKNISDKTITLKKITTSCMCTDAKFVVDGKESRSFGMEMDGDLNPIISLELKPQETAQLVFNFDPKAHGPEGVGSFERTITLFFDTGFWDFEFNGQVVK